MKTIIFAAVLTAAICSTSFTAIAYEPYMSESGRFKVVAGADLVSKYVWRGVNQSGASIQPTLGMEVGGFFLEAWGSTTFNDNFKELDVSIGYGIGGLTLAVTDYWWDGEGMPFYKHYTDSHLFEGTVEYYFGDDFPLTLGWNTFFAGEQDKNSRGKRKYSSYIEAGYDFSIGSFDFTASAGFAPWQAPAWLDEKNGFRVSQIALEARKEIRFNPAFSLGVFLKAIASPATDNAYLVAGITF
ncbi:MAG: hypothetical protein LUE26_02195 [Alistipes sp.]|nr:hypothetical protein [Alistipes sp.]